MTRYNHHDLIASATCVTIGGLICGAIFAPWWL